MPEPSHVPAAEPGASVDPNSVEGLFVAALAKADPDERRAFLDQACGDDLQRRQRVEALLRAYDDSGSFLESPPLAGTEELGFDFLQPSSDPSLLGTLGPYEVIEMIGRGGMGIVFRGRDPKLNRVVALKVLAPELAANPNARRRFVREAQAAAAISHPHVVTIHAVDGDAKLPYLVMECIVGQSLQQKLDKQGSLRLTEILRIGKQIAEGLSAAHKQGLIHRDIKPANILLENGVERVKITDFGLARAIDDVSVTRPGEVAGTPQFMSPEQAKGERVDERSDLFCLGCVMYAMCTGRSPFRATSMAAAIRRVCDDSPRPIEEINAELPSWLIRIVNSLLEKNPAKRVQSANEVVALLEDRLAEIQASRPMRRRADEPQPSTGEGANKPGEQSGQEVPRWLLADVSFPFRPSKTTHGIPPRQQTIGSMLTVAGTVVCAGAILLMLLPALMNLPREGYLFDLGVLVAGFTFGLFAVICGTVLRGRPVTSGGMLLILLLLLGPLGLVIWLLRREFYQRQEQLFGQPIQSEQPDQPATASHEDEVKQTDARIGGGRVLASLLLAVVIGLVPSLLVPLDDPDHRIAPGILGVLIGLAMVIADLLERPFGRETRLPPNKILGELRAGQQGAVLLVLSAAYLVPYMLRAIAGGYSFWGTLDDPLPVIALALIVLAVWYWQFHRELFSAAKRLSRSQLWGLLAGAVGLLALAGVLTWPMAETYLFPHGNLLVETLDERTITQVTVDGSPPALASREAHSWFIEGIPAGRHTVKATLSDGATRAFVTTIAEDQTQRIVFGDRSSAAAPRASAVLQTTGAVIIEFVDPGLQVRLEPVDQGSGSWGAGSLTEGTHQIPAGKYTPVVVDDRFGWVAGNSDVYSESMGGMPGMFAADMMGSMDMGGMGASAGGRYRMPPIDVKPGEFTTLTLRRDLKALAKGHPEWRAGQFYEFLWNGRRYTLSAAQGRVVQQLFTATAAGSPSVAESELLAASTSEVTGEASTFPSTPDPFSSALPAGEKLSPVPESAKPESLTALFNDGKHPAWGELIIEGGEAGTYRLAPVEGE